MRTEGEKCSRRKIRETMGLNQNRVNNSAKNYTRNKKNTTNKINDKNKVNKRNRGIWRERGIRRKRGMRGVGVI